jgi:hypothetical protein
MYKGKMSQRIMVYKTKKKLVLLNLLDLQNINWIERELDVEGLEMDSTDWFWWGSRPERLKDPSQGKKRAEYLKRALNNAMRGPLDTSKAWNLKGDNERKMADNVKKSYITFCNKKYGQGAPDAVNRKSIWDDDKILPHILLTLLKNKRCDGYFCDSIPSEGGIFQREIMLIKPKECLNIESTNSLHTCGTETDGRGNGHDSSAGPATGA